MRGLVLLVSALVLAACGGSSPVSGSSLRDQQQGTDDVARLVVSALVEDLGAAPPSSTSLGVGQLVGCRGGGPDEASYFVDTFVTYDVRTAQQATDQVTRSLRAAGLEVDTDGDDLTTTRDGVTVDLTSQTKGGGSAGQNIFVSSGCLAVGPGKVSAFNADPPPVTP